MDFQINDHHDLLQLIAATQLDRISTRFDRLLREQTKAAQGRQKLLAACGFMKDSADAVFELLRGSVSQSNGALDESEAGRRQQALERDYFTLCELTKSVSQADTDVGALETSLISNFRLLKTLVKALADLAGVTVPMLSNEESSSALQSWASDDSVDETEVQNSSLREYYDWLSKEHHLKELIDGSSIQHRELEERKAFFTEQGRPIPDAFEKELSALEAYRVQLTTEHQQAKQVTKRCELHCEKLGIVMTSVEDKHSTESQKQAQDSQPGRIHQWLKELRPEDASIDMDDRFELAPRPTDRTWCMEEDCISEHGVSDLIDHSAKAPDRQSSVSALNKKTPKLNGSRYAVADPSTNHADLEREQDLHAPAIKTQNTNCNGITETPHHIEAVAYAQLEADPRQQAEIKPNVSAKDADRSTFSPTIPTHQIISRTPADSDSQVLIQSTAHPSGNRKEREYRTRHPHSYTRGTIFKINNRSVVSRTFDSECDSTITDRVVGYSETCAQISTQVLWFVVIEVGERSCKCLRLTTNEGKGVADLPRHERKENYSMIYTGNNVPPLTKEEEEHQLSDTGSMKAPIRVKQKARWQKLDPMHRLYWAQPYDVPYDTKSVIFGRIHDDSKVTCDFELRNVRQRQHGGISHRRKTPISMERQTASIRSPVSLPSASVALSMTAGQGTEMRTIVSHSLVPQVSEYSTLIRRKVPQSKFKPGDLVDYAIDQTMHTQQRRCRRLVVRQTRFSDGQHQYQLAHPQHHGLFSRGRWICESPWIVPARL